MPVHKKDIVQCKSNVGFILDPPSDCFVHMFAGSIFEPGSSRAKGSDERETKLSHLIF